jgi:hypothetical protein
VFFASHEYVVKLQLSFNVWKEEWLVDIGVLKEGDKKIKKATKFIYFWKSDLIFVGKYINGSKLGTNGDGQDYKTIKVDHNFLIFKFIFPHFLCCWNMLKVDFLISNFIVLKYLIFCLNQSHVNTKSHVSYLTITMHHIKILKTLKFLYACCYLRVHELKLYSNTLNWFQFHIGMN